MKRFLAYIFIAVLLGIVTMLAPFALFVSETDTNEMDAQAKRFNLFPTDTRAMSSEAEQTYGITPVVNSTDIVFVPFLSVFSFVVALGVMSYFKERNVQ